jgi:hypothetical protein
MVGYRCGALFVSIGLGLVIVYVAKTPLWQRQLGKGDPRITFLIGIALTLPGASYLAALSSISKEHLSRFDTFLVVVSDHIVHVDSPPWLTTGGSRSRSRTAATWVD